MRPSRCLLACCTPRARHLGFFLLFSIPFLLVIARHSRPLAQPCAPPPSDMVSWWPAEGNADDIQDGSDGVMLNGATFGAGKVGQAFCFDAVDDKMQAPHNSNQNTGAQITIEAWVNLTSSGHGRPIANKRSDNNVGGYTLETTDAPYGAVNGLQFVLWIGGVQRVLVTPTVLTPSAWKHVAATYDGTAMKIYIDAVEVVSMAMTGAIDATADPFVVGYNVRIPTFVWGGYIDELHLFNRALSLPEIQAIYSAGAGGICVPTAVGPAPLAEGVALSQNYPNPFNPQTVISYELPHAHHVQLTVHDAAGRLVRSLVDGTRPAGSHDVSWDGKNERGSRVSTGVYFYRLRTGAMVLTRKMVLLK